MLVSNNLVLRNIHYFELKLIILDFFWSSWSRFLLKEMHGKSTKIVKRIIIILLGKPWKKFYILMRSLKSKIATNFLLLNLSSCLQISRPTNFLLLHISGLFTIITLLFIIFSAPSLFSKSNIGGNFLCGFQGFTNFLFHPLALWTVAGAHLDRFYFIAYPLR